MCLVLRIEKNACDEKTGQDKENLDANPAPRQSDVVVEEDHQESDSSQSIESGVEGLRLLYR